MDLRKLIGWVEKVNVLAGTISAGLFVFLTLLVTVHVILRPLGHPIIWTEEVTRFCLVWGVMLGMALTLQKGRHIRVTMLVSQFPRILEKILECLGDLVAIVVLCFFVSYSYKFTVFTKNLGEISQGALYYPIWWAEVALPIGGILFVFRYIFKFFEDVLKVAEIYREEK